MYENGIFTFNSVKTVEKYSTVSEQFLALRLIYDSKIGSARRRIGGFHFEEGLS